MTTRQRLEAMRLARARHHRDGSGLLAVEVGGGRGMGSRAARQSGAVVHAVFVAGRVAVGRHIDLTRGQRVPADGGGAARLPSVMLTLTPPVPTQPTRGGRIDRAVHVAARHPAPTPAPDDPAPVVERRKAPRRIVHPGPAPMARPGPVAKAVSAQLGTTTLGIHTVPHSGAVSQRPWRSRSSAPVISGDT